MLGAEWSLLRVNGHPDLDVNGDQAAATVVAAACVVF
jgi:hypothetical protein